VVQRMGARIEEEGDAGAAPGVPAHLVVHAGARLRGVSIGGGAVAEPGARGVSTDDRNSAAENTMGGPSARPSEISMDRSTEASVEIASLIDEIPMLAVLAARAEGTTVVRGAAELRVKESDRIAAVVSNLRAIGVEAHELPDGLVVQGTDAPLAGHVRTHGDHRIAMAFGTLGATRGCEITLDDPGCVSVSYPGFWEELARVAR